MQHVGSFGHVELALAERLADVAGVHLVPAPVAQRRRRPCRFAERAVEGGGVLRGVGDDRRRRAALEPSGSRRPGRPSCRSGRRRPRRPRRARRPCGRAARARRRCRPRRRRRTPQWPCAVYSHRQTSVSRSSSGNRGRSARSARCTIPSSIQAPDPSSSLLSGIPNRITAFTPDRSSSSHSRTTPSTVCRDIAGSCSLASASGATKSGITRSSAESVVSRTSSRSAPVRRRRRSLVVGNVLMETG